MGRELILLDKFSPQFVVEFRLSERQHPMQGNTFSYC